jgi:hypothetical protein
MLRILTRHHVGRPGVLGGLRSHAAAAVVILLPVNRIGRGENQTQPAAFLQPPGEESERCELVPLKLAGLGQSLLTTRLALARPLQVVGQKAIEELFCAGCTTGASPWRVPAR